jgi:hypothetical protein
MAAAVVKPPGTTMQPTPKPVTPTKQREPGASPKRNGRPGTALRVVISLWIVWHFTGVFLAALSIPPTSPLVLDIAQSGKFFFGAPLMQWYLDAMYLNQGHSFFAPEVGPGNLIRYELYDQSGRVTEQGELPSKKDYWPRLRYHRHFMLADQSSMPGDEQFSKQWQRKYLQSYARHLLRVNESAQAVKVQRIAHWPLPRDYKLQGRTLTDPEGYEILTEFTERRNNLLPDNRGQSQMMWQSGGYQTAQPWMGNRR